MLPTSYEESVYAGVLGKIIGVYLGRPFEGWSNERIESNLGEIDYYVHDKVGVPLIVTDDDISGTFTFIRALEDYHCDVQLTPKQIGQTWLNYLIDGRSVLWWGGLGNSTEHTAYLRLRQGIDAPHSGSIAMNGQVVAEQIGAQIFIDGWAMVCPGDPEKAADFARRAGSVSHDGEAVYGAQVLAAMEAMAFVEKDIDKLVDTGLAQIPSDSVLTRMIGDIREWHAKNGDDWRASFKGIQENYGYDKYGGNCHIVPNHGLIVLALLHGNGDFSRSLMIVNTAGWDTDCNSGNLGCLMGIRNGLPGIDAGPDWRGPFSDICYIPTADSGGGVTDAVSQAQRIASIGRQLNGESSVIPKDGARYHFAFPGSTQGFQAENCELSNELTPSGNRALLISAPSGTEPVCAITGTFVDSIETAKYFERRGYGLMTSPSLDPGQTVKATVNVPADADSSVDVAVCIKVFNEEDGTDIQSGPHVSVEPGDAKEIQWCVPSTNGYPIAGVGIELLNSTNSTRLFLDRMDWSGAPEITLARRKGTMWNRAWVNAVDSYHPFYPEGFRLIQNRETGLLLYGSRQWTDYEVTADVTPHLVRRAGLACRVQGMRRYYALVITQNDGLQLIRELDGTRVLARADRELKLGTRYQFKVRVNGNKITGSVDGSTVLEAEDTDLGQGGIALLIDEGRTATREVSVRPLS